MFIKLSEFEMYYVRRGNKNGPVLILIHGNGGSHKEFDASMEILEGFFDIYAIDCRNCGQSICKNISMHYDLMVGDLHEFITDLNLKDFTLCGFSDGGIISLLYEIKYSGSAGNLILCGTNLNPKGIKNEFNIMEQEALKNAKNQFEKNNILMMIKEPNITNQDLLKVKAKTLVLAGENDLIKLEHTIKIADHIANATYKIVPNEDHSSYIIGSNKLAILILEFFNIKA